MTKLSKLPCAMLFDLDGTLTDTIGQLSAASCKTAKALGLGEVSTDTVRGYVGNGVYMLLARVIKGKFDTSLEEVDPKLLQKARALFGEFYMSGLGSDYRIYDGVKEGLGLFKAKGIKLAVATNKPEVFAKPLLKLMGLDGYFDFILGGEVLKERKPSPEPLFYVCSKLGVPPASCVMVGDSENDVLAGNRAGMSTVFFTYGYNHSDIDAFKPDYKFCSFSELVTLISSLK